jgi:hypothetical protein
VLYALLASVVAGLLLAAVAFPVVGGLSLTAKAGADEFLVLPAELETAPLPQRTRILAADGSQIAVLYRQNRVSTTIADVPELTRQAVIATEDARFYSHNGVDVKGTLRAAVENAQAGGVSQGGSTLTQQYVKNALLQAADGSEAAQDAARELSLERKMKEGAVRPRHRAHDVEGRDPRALPRHRLLRQRRSTGSGRRRASTSASRCSSSRWRRARPSPASSRARAASTRSRRWPTPR